MRTLAIGDVHGCSAALDHLLELVRPGPDDRLVFLGDYVDRGTPPHGSGKQVVCGHTSQKSGEPLHLGHLVCIDTHAHGGGWLTCLHAETGRIWQADQRGRTRTGYLDEPGD